MGRPDEVQRRVPAARPMWGAAGWRPRSREVLAKGAAIHHGVRQRPAPLRRHGGPARPRGVRAPDGGPGDARAVGEQRLGHIDEAQCERLLQQGAAFHVREIDRAAVQVGQDLVGHGAVPVGQEVGEQTGVGDALGGLRQDEPQPHCERAQVPLARLRGPQREALGRRWLRGRGGRQGREAPRGELQGGGAAEFLRPQPVPVAPDLQRDHARLGQQGHADPLAPRGLAARALAHA
mmetsp:Transcript_91955/g.281368  ORF Transcript_91955/g.281368 Transcript_91955/m.281368 type:complete len:235 (-) Transcript_91955:1233-1937(-)